ncbi:hypothetical protein H6F76_04325 [Leptolyngbya sp. FACHB-321]|uniref:hypothetical protein n=1 Tax=Leptolyngbya sp. FACHB-321 TaxID=2692807 RepID=UPI0016831403|nr:hypothetical protein [Leptolyngbya sp. FACHB-321]MBD2034268.1 hypothetical protein [Leptolyngbya sp. FACHB-321]
MNTDASSDETWANWLQEHGIQLGSAKEDIVPLASGGTFAEAMLRRSNCAEKLDITRFWNWQDSPIPLQPNEIAAIQTGSRATNEDTKPVNEVPQLLTSLRPRVCLTLLARQPFWGQSRMAICSVI